MCLFCCVPMHSSLCLIKETLIVILENAQFQQNWNERGLNSVVVCRCRKNSDLVITKEQGSLIDFPKEDKRNIPWLQLLKFIDKNFKHVHYTVYIITDNFVMLSAGIRAKRFSPLPSTSYWPELHRFELPTGGRAPNKILQTVLKIIHLQC